MKKYSESIMQASRQRRWLDKNDISMDNEIMQESKETVFRDYCLWNGLMGDWHYNLLKVIENIYDVQLYKEPINDK